jgi:uncharacterized protein
LIHTYRFQNQNIVLDVGSGAVHAVSDVAYAILSFFEETQAEQKDWDARRDDVRKRLMAKYDEETLLAACLAIDELAEQDMLFTSDFGEEALAVEGRGAVVKAMCLHVAHDCNMRCAYCFAGTGNFSGPRALLPLATGKKAIDFLIARSGSRRNLEIDFFGGEPLMNFEVVKALIQYGREREQEAGKRIRFTITTNGLLLDEKKEAFLNEHMDNVILSLDGRRAVHDRMRKTPSGAGTYDHVIANCLRFQAHRKGLYYVRGTYTAYNRDFAEDVRWLTELGFHNISVEPVVTEQDRDYALRIEDLPALLSEYDRLAELYLAQRRAGKPFSFFHFNVDLNQGPCVFKRAAGCGAGTEYVAVSPEGDIYPCHQFVGQAAFRLGNVNEPDFQNHLYDHFNGAHIHAKEACRRCWAKYYCSGGCHANAIHTSGDIMRPHEMGCVLERKRLECAIGLRAMEGFADFADQ